MSTLAEQDCYKTSVQQTRSCLSRLCPWTRAAFYLPVFGVVLRASLQATRGRLDDRNWVAASDGIVRAMEGVGMRLTIEGMNVLRAFEGPAVFVANHMSTLETFVLPGIIQPVKPVTFVVKDSLLRYPIFGPIMRSRDPVAVGRRNPRKDLVAVLEGGRERLARGISIVVFPQTTRAPRFEPSRFNTIGVKLAARAGVPAVPLALKTDALPVHFRFGAPIAPEGKGNQAHETVVRFIRQAMEEWAGSEG
jgi:1-acyl-sn-glycerol-3-phosphate acyltransferase